MYMIAFQVGFRPVSAEDAVPRRHDACHLTPGILPSALRASLWLFKIAPGDVVEPLDFIARLAALVPKPRVNPTRLARIIPDTHRASRAS